MAGSSKLQSTWPEEIRGKDFCFYEEFRTLSRNNWNWLSILSSALSILHSTCQHEILRKKFLLKIINLKMSWNCEQIKWSLAQKFQKVCKKWIVRVWRFVPRKTLYLSWQNWNCMSRGSSGEPSVLCKKGTNSTNFFSDFKLKVFSREVNVSDVSGGRPWRKVIFWKDERRDFCQFNVGPWVRSFWHVCRNYILRVQRIFWGKKYLEN